MIREFFSHYPMDEENVLIITVVPKNPTPEKETDGELWDTKKGMRFIRCANLDKVVETFDRYRGSHSLFFNTCLIRKDGSSRGRDVDCTIMPLVYADIDTASDAHGENLPAKKDVADFLKSGRIELPSCVINSGNGLHWYWLLRNPLDLRTEEGRKQGKQCLRYVTERFDGWFRENGWGYKPLEDFSRCMRVPTSVNRKRVGVQGIQTQQVWPKDGQKQPVYNNYMYSRPHHFPLKGDFPEQENGAIQENNSGKNRPDRDASEFTVIDPEEAMRLAREVCDKVEATWNNDGSNYVIHLCHICVRNGLEAEQAVPLVVEMAKKLEGCPKKWTEKEVLTRYKDAREKGTFGSDVSEVVIANFELVSDGKKMVRAERKMPELLESFGRLKLDLVNHLGDLCLIQGDKYRVLEDSSSFFAKVHMYARVQWDSRFIAKTEFFKAVMDQAPRVENIELTPHFPKVEGCRYLVDIEPKNTGKLEELLDLMNPSGQFDRVMLKAAILTMSWGGPPGRRPGFAILSDVEDAIEGIGSGKTTVCQLITRPHLLGGLKFYDVPDGREVLNRLVTHIVTRSESRSRVILLDNFHGTLRGKDFEKLLTAPEYSGHAMFRGHGSMPNRFIWLANGNDMTLSDDMSERFMPIKIRRADYDTKFHKAIQSFDWMACMQDVAWMFEQEPAKVSKPNRWGEWCDHVLARCTHEPDVTIHLLRAAQKSVSSDLAEKQSVKDSLIAYLDNHMSYLDKRSDGGILLKPSDIQVIFQGSGTRLKWTSHSRLKAMKRWENLDGLLVDNPNNNVRGYIYYPEGAGF